MKRAKRRFGLRGEAVVMTALLVGCGSKPEADVVVPITPPKTKLLASDGAPTDSFGASVSISNDVLIVGAVFDDDLGTDSGSAYIFAQDAQGQWQEAAKVLGNDVVGGDNFGFSVAISGDFAVVGAPYHSVNGVASGAAYVFKRNAEMWEQFAKLVPTDAAKDDQFGYAVAMDGNRFVIGAPGADALAMDSGAAYTFAAGVDIVEQTKLLPSDSAAAGYFGISVSVSDSTAIVGAWDDGDGSNAGAAYVYQTDGQSWLQTDKLVASNRGAGDMFGYAVALHGGKAIVTAAGDDDKGNDGGAAYVFADEAGQWVQHTKLVPSDGHAGSVFGSSVALWGNTATIGAYWDDEQGQYSGSVYTYAEVGESWDMQEKYVPTDGFPGQIFGSAVAMNASTAIIGAYGDKENGKDSGAVYLISLVNP